MKNDFSIIVASILVLGVLPTILCADDDLFRDQIVPIFASSCVGCHNQSKSEGDFSLRDSASFFAGDHVQPGDSSASYLIELISSDDGTRPEMPKTGPALTVDQVNAIKKWIDAGARWPAGVTIESEKQSSFDWWSLKPIERPAVPQFDDDQPGIRIRNPIDAFVLRKLIANSLSLSAEADRRTLIRRITYDLTGLPPSFDEIESFVNDEHSNAYERLVDRLLASPRYGERWAQHWLDVVKYADTCGYDKDKLRSNAWPYRDYVIRSFNEDKPYKQFVREQIAGDVLYPDSRDGIVGLGFIAAGPWDFIGHVEVPESKVDGMVARNLDRDDMVTNTLNTFCSVTIQCARCHDHKFDPISQEHYYALQAVFAAVDRADRVYADDPDLDEQRDEQHQKIKTIEHRLAEIQSKISQEGGGELERLQTQIEQAQLSRKQVEFGYHSHIAAFAEVEKWVEVQFAQSEKIKRIVLRPCHDDFADIGAGFGFPVRFRIEVDGSVVFDQTAENFENPKLEPVEIPISTSGKTVRLIATRLAERRNDYIFALAELLVLDPAGNNIARDAVVKALDSIEMPPRWRTSNLVDGIWYESGDKQLADLERRRTELVTRVVGKNIVDSLQQLKAELAKARGRYDQIPAGKMVYAATTEFPQQGSFKPTGGKARPVRLLQRGDVQQPGRLMPPGRLPLTQDDDWKLDVNANADEGQRRAALARWLTLDENPLTWRSIVNRVWHYHFGRGIVETPNDFGRMGGEPSHPDLLDWLAAEFRDSGGSLKDLHRLIVTSSVYRQSSIPEDESAQLAASKSDSQNRFLWRMNRRRLSAEEIRDTILYVSGQLNLEMGGPGYYLFELEKTEHSPHYEYHRFDHTDPNSYRRSIYRFIVRSQPDPFMTTLDCADSSQSTPSRNETQTPLQSLTMLNSQFNLSMAETFANRLRSESDSIDHQIRQATRLAIGRNPTGEELDLMRNYAELHGLENFARMVFNLSEFIYVD